MPALPAINKKLLPGKMLYFFYFAGFAVPALYLNVYYRSIGLSGTQIGLINTIAPLVGIFSSALWGLFNDRFGRVRLLLLAAATGSALSMFGLAAVPTFAWVVMLASCYSLFNSPTAPLLDNINLHLLGDHQEGYGRQRIFGSLSYIMVTFVLGQFLQRYGLHWMFAIYALLSLFFAVSLVWLPRQTIHWSGSVKLELVKLIRQPDWIIFSVSVLLLWAASSGIYNFLAIYLKSMGATEGLLGIAWSLSAVAELPALFFSAPLIRKFGPVKLLFVSYFFYMVRMLLYAIMPSPSWAPFIALMHGVTFGLFWMSSVTYINQLAPPEIKATSQGLLSSILSLGTLLSAPISGVLYDRAGPSRLFLFYAGLCAAALVLFWIGSRRLTLRRASDAPPPAD